VRNNPLLIIIDIIQELEVVKLRMLIFLFGLHHKCCSPQKLPHIWYVFKSIEEQSAQIKKQYPVLAVLLYLCKCIAKLFIQTCGCVHCPHLKEHGPEIYS